MRIGAPIGYMGAVSFGVSSETPVPLYLLVVQEEPVAQVFSAHSGRPQIEPTLATLLARKLATTPISAPNSRIEWPQGFAERRVKSSAERSR